MRKVSTFLCGIILAVLVSGCGAKMPDLTQEETDLISEYAVGVLLKYDKHYSSRLVDTTGYDVVVNEIPEQEPEPELEEEPDSPADETEVVDISQDEETFVVPATIEEYYGISDFVFNYTGYELQSSYPPNEDENAMVFAMDATEGSQLLVLRFAASNISSSDQTLDMPSYGARFRVSVNGESSMSTLTTMLLNDLQTYDDVIPAGSSVELVSIVEVPQSTSINTIEFILRGGDANASMRLQ